MKKQEKRIMYKKFEETGVGYGNHHMNLQGKAKKS